MTDNDLLNKLLGAIKVENEKGTHRIKKERIEKRIIDIERRSTGNSTILFGIETDSQNILLLQFSTKYMFLLETIISES